MSEGKLEQELAQGLVTKLGRELALEQAPVKEAALELESAQGFVPGLALK